MYHADTSPLEKPIAPWVSLSKTQATEGTDAANNVINWLETELEDVLMEQFKGHPLQFWNDLQMFHDHNEHFNEVTGLTEKGKQTVKDLHANWGLNFVV